MRKTFTKLGLFTLLNLFLLACISGQTPFWTEDFSDQADFEANWVNGGTNAGTELWEWTDMNVIFQGQPPFASTTVDNGFIIFNSDSNGENSHDVTITSPAINTTGQTSVFLRCENQYGFFSDPSISIAEVGVSTDGANFTYREVLTDVQQNDLSDAVQIVVLELPEAVDQPQVFIQFRWRGFFEYFWKIDDISLSSGDPTAANDLKIDQVRGAFNFATPETQIDTAFFINRLTNLGTAMQTNVVAQVDVSKDDVNVFSATESLGEVGAGAPVDTIAFEDTYLPDGVGNYTITYSVIQDEEDANPDDNSIPREFIVTENLFSKDDGDIVGANRPGTVAEEFWEIGNYYFTPNAGYLATEAIFSVASEGEVHIGQTVNVFLYKLNLDETPGITDEELEVVGFSTYEFTPADSNFVLVTVELEDINGINPDGVPLEEGADYFLTVALTEEMNIAYSTLTYFWDVATVVKNGTWFAGGFGPDFTAMVRMRIQAMDTAAGEVQLAEGTVKLFPNPAKENLVVDIELENTAERMQLKIMDTAGKILMVNNYEDLQKQRLDLDVSKLAAGAYILHIRTDEGVKAKRFVVSR